MCVKVSRVVAMKVSADTLHYLQSHGPTQYTIQAWIVLQCGWNFQINYFQWLALHHNSFLLR